MRRAIESFGVGSLQSYALTFTDKLAKQLTSLPANLLSVGDGRPPAPRRKAGLRRRGIAVAFSRYGQEKFVMIVSDLATGVPVWMGTSRSRTEEQRSRLRLLFRLNGKLARAYHLVEELRAVFGHRTARAFTMASGASSAAPSVAIIPT